MNAFILGNTSELKPGHSDIEVVIQNRSGRDMKLKPGTKIGTVIAANIIPTLQVSNNFDVTGQERVSSMLAQLEAIDTLRDTSDMVINDLKDLLQKLNLSGIEEWEPPLQKTAKDLICQFTCIFSQDDVDLGKTSIVKHSIEVNDPVSFKVWYRCILPGMYDEIKVHIQEMVDVGAIRPFKSPWASAIVLVQKKMGNYSFVSTCRN